jgi:hypothetical protein
MAHDKKKPSLAAAIDEMKSGGSTADDEDAPESESGGDEDYSASVDELFDALKNDDRDAFHDAFKAAVMSCK